MSSLLNVSQSNTELCFTGLGKCLNEIGFTYVYLQPVKSPSIPGKCFYSEIIYIISFEKFLADSPEEGPPDWGPYSITRKWVGDDTPLVNGNDDGSFKEISKSAYSSMESQVWEYHNKDNSPSSVSVSNYNEALLLLFYDILKNKKCLDNYKLVNVD